MPTDSALTPDEVIFILATLSDSKESLQKLRREAEDANTRAEARKGISRVNILVNKLNFHETSFNANELFSMYAIVADRRNELNEYLDEISTGSADYEYGLQRIRESNSILRKFKQIFESYGIDVRAELKRQNHLQGF